MSKERFLSDVRTARTFSDTKFAQSLTWANKEILRLAAALDSANQRAEEAERSLEICKGVGASQFVKRVKDQEEIDRLKASLADKRENRLPKEPPEGLLMSMAVRSNHGLGVDGHYDQFGEGEHKRRLEATIREMRQLYEEVSGHGFFDWSAIPTESPDTRCENGSHTWKCSEEKGWCLDCNLPAPSLAEIQAIESPDTGEE